MTNFEKAAAIHASVGRGFFVCSGGGSGLLSALLSVPGASRTVLEARVPYSAEAMTSFLGRRPEQFCSEPTARRIAAMAWYQARKLTPGDDSVFGFSLTATLATQREHRGEHRAFAAFQSAERTVSYSLELAKDKADRTQEEQIVTDWALDLVSEFCGILPASHKPTNDCTAPVAWRQVLTGALSFVELHRDGSVSETLSPQIDSIFPGSYAPIHSGHGMMHACAQRLLGKPPALELAVLNADKPPLDYITISERLERIWAEPAFRGNCVILSGLPFFEQKAEAFPGRTFIVGMDTLERIADTKYHHDEPILLEKSLRRISETGARFLVFGRVKSTSSGKFFETFQPDRVPGTLAKICHGVPEEIFRKDVSSTEIRSRQQR